MKRFGKTLLACSAVCLVASDAMAAGGPQGDFRDPQTGFEVKVPENYLQTPARPANGVSLKRAGDEGVFCEARFEPIGESAVAPRPAARRDYVRGLVRRWRASRAGGTRTFVSAAPFPTRSDKEPAAVAIVSDRRGELAAYPRQKRRSLTIVWETAKGRSTLACEAPKVRFGILRREFEALAAGVAPP